MKKEETGLGPLGHIALGLIMGIGVTLFESNRIPEAKQVQEGYAIPNKLEIELQDLDGNGEKETLMTYDKKSYLLKLDEDGRLNIREYEIIPTIPSRVEIKE